MFVQTLLVFLLLAVAAVFLGRRAWQAFFAKEVAGCAKGCGACGTLDIDRLQRTIEAQHRRAVAQA